MFDELIAKYKLKCARVVRHKDEANGMPIDFNDDYARIPDVSFFLLDNHYNSKKDYCKQN